jgi:hypothetical protein
LQAHQNIKKEHTVKTIQAIVFLLTLACTALAAEPVSGDWSGVIKVRDMDLRLVLHITDSGKGLQATFDSVDQKVLGMPVDKIEVKGQQLKFEIGLIGASYAGTLNKTGTSLTGAWSQIGMSFPLNFQKTSPARK